jgi:hypothetical protein
MKEEVGGACGMCGGVEKLKRVFGGRNLSERDHLEDLERINWAEGKARWQALVNAEMNLWVV